MKRTLKSLAILGIAAMILNGCKKEGPVGPAGKDGNANIASRNFVVSSWLWSSPYHYVNLNMPELTSSNINSAAVMVYFRTNGDWAALPYAQYDSPYDYFMGFNTGVSNVQVTWFYDSSLSSGDNPTIYYGTNVNYKVVVVPPAERKAHPDLDLRNYKEVKLRFNLDD